MNIPLARCRGYIFVLNRDDRDCPSFILNSFWCLASLVTGCQSAVSPTPGLLPVLSCKDLSVQNFRSCSFKFRGEFSTKLWLAGHITTRMSVQHLSHLFTLQIMLDYLLDIFVSSSPVSYLSFDKWKDGHGEDYVSILCTQGN